MRGGDHEGAAMMSARFSLITMVLLSTLPCLAGAQRAPDPPWNAHHIDQLPAAIRQAVLAKCPSRASAGHYFVTYYRDEVRLHFEHFHCEGVSFCDKSGCLHQVYGSTGGRYRLLRTFRAPAND